MKIGQAIADSSRFLSEAFARIFSPTDDIYPLIGVQPFSGDLSDKHRHFDW